MLGLHARPTYCTKETILRRVALLLLIAGLLGVGCAIATTPTARPAPTATTAPAPAATSTAAKPTATLVPTATAGPTRTPTTVPTATPIPPARLFLYPAGSLLHPLDVTIAGDTAYAIDSGQLKALDLLTGANPRLVTPPGNQVEGYPVQELASLTYSPAAKALYLLDRSGSIYGWDLANRWWLERDPGGNNDYAQEYPVDLVANDQAAYMLDTNNGRVWRHTTGDWTSYVVSNQLDAGIRMAIAGNDMYVLVGERPSRPAQLFRLRGTAVSEIKVAGMEQPSFIAAGPAGSLMLVDHGFQRLRLLSLDTGAARDVLSGDHADVYTFANSGDMTVLLGSNWMMAIRGALPEQLTIRPSTAPIAGMQPNAPAVLATLPRVSFPIAGGHLPDIDRSLPGAPRPYRFGIHEGIDLYSSTIGVAVVKGTEVHAIADGVVLRADTDYKETSSAQMDEFLSETVKQRMTPPAIQDRLGGRQVWLDHGNGLGSRYLHLSRIAAGLQTGMSVKAGDVIGYAGNSGTPEAAAGSNDDVHLHFEIRLGNGRLGQWIAPIETRRALMQLFGQ
jgi:murein DD-endopeptidase MepM/ murein hydrolase activator NlpD